MSKAMRQHTPNSARIVGAVLALLLASGGAWYFLSVGDQWMKSGEAVAATGTTAADAPY